MSDAANIDLPALLAALEPVIEAQAQQKSIPRAVLVAYVNDLAAREALLPEAAAAAEQIESFARRFDRAYRRLTVTSDLDAGLAAIRLQAADLLLRSEYDEGLRMIRAERLLRPDERPFERRVLWADEASVDFLLGRWLDAAEKFGEAAKLAEGESDRLATLLWDQAEALRHEALYRDDDGLLLEVIALYRRVKALRSAEADAIAFAETCIELGLALHAYGERTGTPQSLQEAAEALRDGLAGLNPNTDLSGWMQNRLGLVLMSLAQTECGEGAIDQAIESFQAAAEAFDRETSPHDWARAHVSHGQALRQRGDRRTDWTWREQAFVAYSAAMEVITRDTGDLEWAGLKIECGELLVEISFDRPGTAEIRGAIAVYRDALTVFTRERDTRQWVILQVRIGDALRNLARRGEDMVESLRGAVTAYQLGLQGLSRDEAPAVWSDLQERIGTTCVMLCADEDRRMWLSQAIDAFRAAGEAISRRETPLVWARIQNNLGSALSMRGGEDDDPVQLEQAVRALRDALLERRPEEVPEDWAATQCNLGNALLQLGQRDDDVEQLLEALTVFRDALEVQLQHCSGYDCALTHKDIGDVLTALGDREDGQDMMREAIDFYREALVIIDDKDPELEKTVRDRMARTEALLAARNRPH